MCEQKTRIIPPLFKDGRCYPLKFYVSVYFYCSVVQYLMTKRNVIFLRNDIFCCIQNTVLCVKSLIQLHAPSPKKNTYTIKRNSKTDVCVNGPLVMHFHSTWFRLSVKMLTYETHSALAIKKVYLSPGCLVVRVILAACLFWLISLIYLLSVTLLRGTSVTKWLQFQGGLTTGRQVVKTIAESLLQHDENMLYRPHLVGSG
jgi:hypothetical protein